MSNSTYYFYSENTKSGPQNCTFFVQFLELSVRVLLTAQFFILMSLAWKIHSTPFQNMKNLFWQSR